MKHYDSSLINALQTNIIQDVSFSCPIIIKSIPLSTKQGLDPREKELALKTIASRTNQEISISSIRNNFGYENDDISSSSLKEKTLHFKYDNLSFEVIKTSPKTIKVLPSLIYIHGGSFFCGKASYYQNICRFLAEKLNVVVFNINYALAPEFPYPIGLNQCRYFTSYLIKHHRKYHINPHHIILCGDSSGGNFASVIANEMKEQILLQVLYYPAVYFDLTKPLKEWDLKSYDIPQDEKDLIEPRLILGRADGKSNLTLSKMILNIYLQHHENPLDESISSYYGSLNNVCKTLIFTAEYDGLRIIDEMYAGKLYQQNKNVTLIRYRGIHHAFLEKIGYFPQAEDSIIEIKKVLDDLLNK
jgi:acetyl esterase/lipase